MIVTSFTISMFFFTTHCSACNESLDRSKQFIYEKRQKIEIPPISPEVTEYGSYGVKCTCGHINRGAFPNKINAYLQMGERIQSFLVYLNISHLLPFERLSKVCFDLFGLSVSKGSIENFLKRANTKAQDAYGLIHLLMKKSKWIGSDETQIKVGGKKHWQWVWQND